MDHTISYSFCSEGIGLQSLRFLLVFVVSTNLSHCHFPCTYTHTHINTHMTVLTFWSTNDQSWLKEIWNTTVDPVPLLESGYVFYVSRYHMVAFGLWMVMHIGAHALRGRFSINMDTCSFMALCASNIQPTRI